MSTREIVWQVPENLYRELVWAQEELAYPDLLDFITQAVQRRLAEIRHEAWQREFRQLQRDVYATGGFGLGETRDEVIENLREIRQQIFEEEYAHLYGAGPEGKDNRG
jgi:queuine/archaeosine tRNA-ribosyltransferase